MKQTAFLKKNKLAYGGELLKTREGRRGGRPIDTKNSMHLVLRSSKAVNEFSFRQRDNQKKVDALIKKFALRFGITIHSYANNGNHLHFHIQLKNRRTYAPFIRALTAAIAMLITGASRWRPSKIPGSFWDYRPFSRVVTGFKSFMHVKNYVAINALEAIGYNRIEARFALASQPCRRVSSCKSPRELGRTLLLQDV